MTGIRRHDLYVLKTYVAVLLTAMLFLSSLFVLFDLAERVDKLPKALGALSKAGRSGTGVLLEFYATFLPFLALRILPVASLLAAGLTFTWLARQNELVPLVASGVPTRRILLPIFLAAVGLMVVHSVLREKVVPTLSRWHDDMQRLLQGGARSDRLQEVPHIQDVKGGRLSMASYDPGARRMEGVWILFRQEGEGGDRPVGYRYPSLRWDDGVRRWVAERGGQRRVFTPVESLVEAETLPLNAEAPLDVEPDEIEVTLRLGAAMGLSSAEVAALARAKPDRTRFTLLLHQQIASVVPTLVLLMIGLPFVFHLGRSNVFQSFGQTLGIVGLYYLVDSFVVDMGARGALNPVVAAWGSHVIFAALGVVLLTTIET